MTAASEKHLLSQIAQQYELLKQMREDLSEIKAGAKQTLTLKEAAEDLDLSEQTVKNLVCARKIQAFKPNGGRLYFSRDVLERYKRQNPSTTEENIESMAVEKSLYNKRKQA